MRYPPDRPERLERITDPDGRAWDVVGDPPPAGWTLHETKYGPVYIREREPRVSVIVSERRDREGRMRRVAMATNRTKIDIHVTAELAEAFLGPARRGRIEWMRNDPEAGREGTAVSCLLDGDDATEYELTADGIYAWLEREVAKEGAVLTVDVNGKPRPHAPPRQRRRPKRR